METETYTANRDTDEHLDEMRLTAVDLDERRTATMMMTITMITATAPADAPAMMAMFGVPDSLGLGVVVADEVGSGIDTAATPTPSPCTHDRDIIGQQRRT